MAKRYSHWTEDEINLIINNYQTKDINWLTEHLPLHTKMSIARKIANMKLTKPQFRKSEPFILLEENPESYYWIGFLMADGSFTERRLSVTYSKKDINHIEKFKTYINSTNEHYKIGETDCYRLCITNINTVSSLIKKFNIYSNKTKNPCNISNIKDDLLFSLIIGFIDGDGSISSKERKTVTSYRLSVVGDTSWLNNFKLMFNFIHKYLNIKATNQQPYIQKHLTSLPQEKDIKREFTTAHYYITNRSVIQKMKQKIIELNLPYMERKWGKVIL